MKLIIFTSENLLTEGGIRHTVWVEELLRIEQGDSPTYTSSFTENPYPSKVRFSPPKGHSNNQGISDSIPFVKQLHMNIPMKMLEEKTKQEKS